MSSSESELYDRLGGHIPELADTMFAPGQRPNEAKKLYNCEWLCTPSVFFVSALVKLVSRRGHANAARVAIPFH